MAIFLLLLFLYLVFGWIVATLVALLDHSIDHTGDFVFVWLMWPVAVAWLAWATAVDWFDARPRRLKNPITTYLDWLLDKENS